MQPAATAAGRGLLGCQCTAAGAGAHSAPHGPERLLVYLLLPPGRRGRGRRKPGRKEGRREGGGLFDCQPPGCTPKLQPPKAPPAPSPSLRPRNRGRHPGSAAAPRRPRPNGTGSSVQQSLLTGGRPLGLLGPDGAATPPPPPSACLPGTPAVPRPPALGASCLHRTSTADTFPEPG